MDPSDDWVRPFVEELLRAGVLLAEVLESLQAAEPAGASPEPLMEMLTGTVRPAVVAAGEQAVRAITPVFDACVQRTLGDLEQALATAREEGEID